MVRNLTGLEKNEVGLFYLGNIAAGGSQGFLKIIKVVRIAVRHSQI